MKSCYNHSKKSYESKLFVNITDFLMHHKRFPKGISGGFLGDDSEERSRFFAYIHEKFQ